ncbi:MAG: glycosyltransferase family 9 protein [Sphingobacteriia bacterium]|nr:MAG: glycosyltransferase family 9 protein [Sphingobacteriia bacterium]
MPQKILVVRFSSIGDIVLTTLALRCLRQQLPQAQIHFLCKAAMAAVLEASPYIDHHHHFKGDLSATIQALKAENFDLVVDWHKNFRSFRLAMALRVPVLSYQKLSWEKFLLTRFGINRMPQRHIALRCLDALAPLGIQDDGQGLDYFIPAGKGLDENDLPLSHRFGYVALVIGASYATKKLPTDKLIALCGKIDYPLVLVGGKEDAAAGEAIAAAHPIRVYNACGKFSLHASAGIVQKAKLVISHDTGLQYMACAFGKTVLAVWGGTSPLLAVEPFYGTAHPIAHTNFLVPGLSCQPCSNYGTKKCPKGHFNCMQLQDLTAMAQLAMKSLGLA